MYAICKNGDCAQTYAISDLIAGRTREQFDADMVKSDGIKCEKCNAVVVERDGRATLSQHPTIIKYATVEDMKKQEAAELKRAKKEFKKAKKKLKQLEKEYTGG